MSLKESNSFLGEVMDVLREEGAFNYEEPNLTTEGTGYVISVCDEPNDSYIVGVSHIEKDDVCDIFTNDEDAQEFAESQGIKLLFGFISIPDNVYLDVKENREKLQSYLTENPLYRIVDREYFSKLLSSTHKEYTSSTGNVSINLFSNHLDVSPAHLSRLLRGLIDYTSSNVVNALINKTNVDRESLLSCVEPIIENFME